MRHPWNQLCLGIFATLALIGAAGCAQKVSLLRIDDPRLPAESQKWIADAEDAVAVARAHRDNKAAELAETENWRATYPAKLKWPGGGAGSKMNAMADARVAVAKLELEKADAELRLAEAKRQLMNAETAMRHDLAVYDLMPIREQRDLARADVKDATGRMVKQRQVLEKASAAFWQAYSAYLKSGGKNDVMWVIEE
jgi:hypothetical protein